MSCVVLCCERPLFCPALMDDLREQPVDLAANTPVYYVEELSQWLPTPVCYEHDSEFWVPA